MSLRFLRFFIYCVIVEFKHRPRIGRIRKMRRYRIGRIRGPEIMAVRVRLLIKHGDKSIESSALVNSGYETDTPQLLVPIPVAEKLELWPPIKALEETYDTAGGPTRVWVYPKKAFTQIVGERIDGKDVLTDIVVSPIEDELLISDKLAGELEIVVEDFGRGLWRLRGEKELRESERPQKWKS